MSKATKKQIKKKICVRSTSHTINFANQYKLNTYKEFLTEYRKIAQIYVNFIWNNEYKFIDSKQNTRIFNTKTDQLDSPSFFDYNLIPIKNETKLSARALSSLVTQCCAVVSSATTARKNLLFRKQKLEENNKPIPKKLLEAIENNKLVKPNTKNLNPEISSKLMDIQESNKHFDMFIRLKCLGEFKSIRIPINLQKQDRKWMNFNKTSERKGSILLTNKTIELKYSFEKEIKTNGKVVGADQGKNTVLSLSDGKVTEQTDKDGHSLSSIMEKLKKKKKGTKAFQRAQDHRENFINWSINELQRKGYLDEYKEIRMEEICNLRKGKRTSRLMSHFTYSLIEKKMLRICEETKVLFSLQPSAFRSQRCSKCGWVHQSNRNKKQFCCVRCGEALDADLNASLNHEIDLYVIPEWLMMSGLNKTQGFYWNACGVFDEDMKEFRVPSTDLSK